MPIQPIFRSIPKDVVEWGRFFRDAVMSTTDGQVTDDSFAPRTGLSVIGRSDSTTGQPADINASANSQFLGRRSDVVSFFTLNSSDIPDQGGNPTASVSLTPVDGVALTFLRSDAAPGLDQTIAPTWTGAHTFSLAGTTSTPSVVLSSTRPVIRWTETDAGADQQHWYAQASAGTFQFGAVNDAFSVLGPVFTVTRSGVAISDITFGGQVRVTAGTTSASSLRIPHGAAPSSPVDGDMWTTTAGLYVRINGVTVGPLS